MSKLYIITEGIRVAGVFDMRPNPMKWTQIYRGRSFIKVLFKLLTLKYYENRAEIHMEIIK